MANSDLLDTGTACLRALLILKAANSQRSDELRYKKEIRSQ